MAVKRVPPVALAGVAVLAQVLLARKASSTRTSKIGAGVLIAASAGLLLSSVSMFRRQGTTVDPLVVDRAESLVTTGVFGLTRNPMYVGMAGALLAHAVLRRSWAACMPVGVFVVLMDQVQIPAEERALREKFGSAFEVYARDAPRWAAIGLRC